MIPLVRDLHILQLEQYWTGRYIKWLVKNWGNKTHLNKTKLKSTAKIKAISLIYFLILGIVYWLVTKNLGIGVGVAVFVLLNIMPFILLGPINMALNLVGKVIVEAVILKTNKKILEYKSLVKIGITGSFGKSSVKNYLWQILAQENYAVKTPLSYNTILGVKKVIDLEIFEKVKYFLVEMGAFTRGDIGKITKMVEPQFGILTAVGKQHLDRFGSVEKVRQTKFELLEGIKDKSKVLVNWDNEKIREWINKNDKYKTVKKYSIKDRQADFWAGNIRLSKEGSSFEIHWGNQKEKINTRLFGSVNVENLTGAIGMALILGVKMDKIKKGIEKIGAVKNRLEIKKIGKATVIDNTYSSNQEGFLRLIADLKKIKGTKALVTPGIVELGRETKSVHQIVGKRAGEVFDEIVLVKESEMTRSLQVGLGRAKKRNKVWFLEDFAKYWLTVQKLSEKYDWVVLENDLPENYN